MCVCVNEDEDRAEMMKTGLGGGGSGLYRGRLLWFVFQAASLSMSVHNFYEISFNC